MLDIIILAMIAVFLISRLYITFGTDAENKMPRIVIKKLNNADDTDKAQLSQSNSTIRQTYTPILCANENKTAENRFYHLFEKIKDFNPDAFLNGAEKMFELVLQAFYDEKMETIKDLVSKKIYDTLIEAILYRKQHNFTTEMELICLEKTEIKDVRMLKNSVKIIVKFVSQQINVLRGADGKILAGDENFIQKITDVWTFERPLNAKENKWILVSTKKTV